MQNLYYCFNGKFIINSQNCITPSNRSFRYGDGFFETIRIQNGQIKLIQLHKERIIKSLTVLKFDSPKHFKIEEVLNTAIGLANKNNHAKSARVRITFFRGDGGLYDAQNNNPNYIIQSYNLSPTITKINENGLQLGFYKACKKAIDAFSNIKTNSFLPYVMGALYAKENKWNDAIIFNTNNTIADTTIANIFIVKNNTIFTPKLSDGCIAGVTRQLIISVCIANNIAIHEVSLTESDLKHADEVFVSNAIKGINWVNNIQENTFLKGCLTIQLAKLVKDYVH